MSEVPDTELCPSYCEINETDERIASHMRTAGYEVQADRIMSEIAARMRECLGSCAVQGSGGLSDECGVMHGNVRATLEERVTLADGISPEMRKAIEDGDFSTAAVLEEQQVFDREHAS